MTGSPSLPFICLKPLTCLGLCRLRTTRFRKLFANRFDVDAISLHVLADCGAKE